MQASERRFVILEDTSLNTIYFDGIAEAVVIGGIVRATAFEIRNNAATGNIERVAVCRFARPVGATMAIRAEFTRAITDAQGLRLAD